MTHWVSFGVGFVAGFGVASAVGIAIFVRMVGRVVSDKIGREK